MVDLDVVQYDVQGLDAPHLAVQECAYGRVAYGPKRWVPRVGLEQFFVEPAAELLLVLWIPAAWTKRGLFFTEQVQERPNITPPFLDRLASASSSR